MAALMSNTPVVEEATEAPVREDYRAFAEALHEAMNRKRMNASALARAIWGTVKDYRGYDVAKNRDRITFYLQGKSSPRDDTLKEIARVLDVPLEHLESLRPGVSGPFPAKTSLPTVDSGVKRLRMTMQDGATVALFECSMTLPATTVLELIRIIEAANAEAAKGPSETIQ